MINLLFFLFIPFYVLHINYLKLRYWGNAYNKIMQFTAK